MAKNGQEVLDLIQSGAVCLDLIITEIKTPVMNGLEFLSAYENLNSCNQQTKVIVSSDTNCEKELAQIKVFHVVEEKFYKPLTVYIW